jgi:predicted transcriptional regulator
MQTYSRDKLSVNFYVIAAHRKASDKLSLDEVQTKTYNRAKMSSDNIQRQIEFILEHQAKFSEDISELKESQKQLTDTVARMASEMEAERRETREVLNTVISEMREGFNNLIIANEATRDLANKVASLEVQTSQRVTGLEHRVTDLESKQ